jgi:hypothetical protein
VDFYTQTEIDDKIDQDLKTTDVVTFNGLYLNGGTIGLSPFNWPYKVSLSGGSPGANRMWRLPIEEPPESGIMKYLTVNSDGNWFYTNRGSLSDVDVTAKSLTVPQSTTPQLIFMKPGSGGGGTGWAAPETSGNSYVLALPANFPENGQGLVWNASGTKDYGGGLSLPTFQGTYVDPSTGSGGTLEITEVATDPNPATLTPGQMVASKATGNIFYKSSTGVYTGAFSYLADADYPIILSATIPTSGTSLIVVYNQDVVDGTELGSWLLSCDNGSYNLTTPAGTTTSAYTYPITGGPVVKNDDCQLYYTMPTDGVEAEDDGAKLQNINGSNITNNSGYIVPVTSGTLFDLDFNDTQSVDLAGWTTVVPAGALNSDSTTYMFDGTQYLYINNNSGGSNIAYSPILSTPVETVYYRYVFRSSSTNTSNLHGPGFKGVGGTVEIGKTYRTSNVYITHGTAQTNVPAVPINTWHYVCGRITVATAEGANDGQHVINVGTSTNPLDNVTASLTNGVRHELIDQVFIGQSSSNSLMIDNVEFSTTEITECGSL